MKDIEEKLKEGARKFAKEYGSVMRDLAKEDGGCVECGGKIWMVEYPMTSPYHYDGISEYACENALKSEVACSNRIGRFCGKRLEPKESEVPYCRGEYHPTHL